MANHVWTRAFIRSDKKEVHNKLNERYGSLSYDDVKGVVEPVFGKDWKYDINLIGSKWIIIEDGDFGGDEETYINFCSAWAPPLEFMEEFNSVIMSMDEEAILEFTGDEESDDFLFAGYGSKNGFHWKMDDDEGPERPWEEECEEEGLDYDECIDRFYDDVNEVQSKLLAECVMEVDINSE